MKGTKSYTYVTSQQIYEEWLKWRDSAVEVKDRVISDELANLIVDIIEKTLASPCYRGYTQEMKEDMSIEAYIKIYKNLKNLDPGRKDKFFSYFVLCAHTAFKTYLGNYYKFVNIKQQLYEDYKANFKQALSDIDE